MANTGCKGKNPISPATPTTASTHSRAHAARIAEETGGCGVQKWCTEIEKRLGAEEKGREGSGKGG